MPKIKIKISGSYTTTERQFGTNDITPHGVTELSRLLAHELTHFAAHYGPVNTVSLEVEDFRDSNTTTGYTVNRN